jgi:acetoin utilization protein AcuB
MKITPQIKDFMTRSPFTVVSRTSLREARWQMRRARVRHLPVVEDGKLVGILGDRDIKSAGFHLGEAADTCLVSEIMAPEPQTVRPEISLMTVVKMMADRKIGSVIVVDEQEKIQGIFTAIDALRFFSSVFSDAQVSEAMAPGFYSSFGIEA